mmetsp:Transcript_15373/g.42637  ORF Transcript_15373/g.42637 Transcript_15373/m.42637 type:complete len:206 (+) Transcript_15373:784-1401(+)
MPKASTSLLRSNRSASTTPMGQSFVSFRFVSLLFVSFRLPNNHHRFDPPTVSLPSMDSQTQPFLSRTNGPTLLVFTKFLGAGNMGNAFIAHPPMHACIFQSRVKVTPLGTEERAPSTRRRKNLRSLPFPAPRRRPALVPATRGSGFRSRYCDSFPLRASLAPTPIPTLSPIAGPTVSQRPPPLPGPGSSTASARRPSRCADREPR